MEVDKLHKKSTMDGELTFSRFATRPFGWPDGRVRTERTLKIGVLFLARSDYVKRETLQHILAALTPPNRLACEISLYTGLRIGDVLELKTAQLKPRMTIQEGKTGKRRAVRLSDELYRRCMAFSGHTYIFPGRLAGTRHRTRQAVYKDIKRAAALFRVGKALQISPHTCRKVYAVCALDRGASLAKVRQLLNHDSEAVTMLYAMADEITARAHGPRGGAGGTSPQV